MCLNKQQAKKFEQNPLTIFQTGNNFHFDGYKFKSLEELCNRIADEYIDEFESGEIQFDDPEGNNQATWMEIQEIIKCKLYSCEEINFDN